MNYDLNTEEGMKNSIEWTNKVLSMIKEGGVWYIPRSYAVVEVVSHAHKQLYFQEGEIPEPSIRRVLEAAGWTIL